MDNVVWLILVVEYANQRMPLFLVRVEWVCAVGQLIGLGQFGQNF